MKKVIRVLIVAFIVSISFGFILFKKPVLEKSAVEDTTIIQSNETGGEITMIQETNDDQW